MVNILFLLFHLFSLTQSRFWIFDEFNDYFNFWNITIISYLPRECKIANYLKASSDVKCYVVGHTDMDGSLALNMDLSMRRAKAYLEVNAGITSDRLIADGVGPLAPVSTNETEFGKKMNRRVELVKQ